MPTATPTPRPRPEAPPAVRPVPAARPAARTAPRPAPTPALAARKASAGRTAATGRSLPGWADLDPTGVAARTGRTAAGQRKAAQLADRKADRPAGHTPARLRPFDAVPSLRFGLLVLLACIAGTLFVAHVYATRATLAELQEARRESEHLRLAGQRLRGEFDRMTGPDAVMPRAAALGLVEGVAYGVPIQIDTR